MSLLNIVKNVMDSNGWPQVTASVAASQDQNMRQCFALANRSVLSTSFKKNWPVLVREFRFPTVSDTEGYALPADFHHLVAPSAINETQYLKLRGALTAMQWYRKAVNGSVDWGSGFRIDLDGKMFRLAPKPAGADNMVFMYITTDIVKSSSGAPLKQYFADTDVALVDEDIIELGLSWRWRQKKGMDFSAELAEYAGTMNLRYAQQLGYGELPIGAIPSGGAPLTSGTLPMEFGA